MRKLIPILTLTLLAGCAAPLQTTSTGETANAVVIQTSDTPGTAFRRVAQIVAQQGFTVRNSDADIGTLSTEVRPIRGDSQGVRASLYVQESDEGATITITGYSVTSSLGELRVEAAGQSGSPMARAWEALASIATAYPGARIEYLRK